MRTQEIEGRIYQPAAQIETIAVLIEGVHGLKIDAEIEPGLTILLKDSAKKLFEAQDDLHELEYYFKHLDSDNGGGS